MPGSFPPVRREPIVVQEMDGELIAYDSTREQANLLNRTAAVIWKLCDGKTGVSDIAVRASKELDTPVNTALVWYTLEQLSKKNLLVERATLPVILKGMTRREFLRAGVVGAAVVLPVIVTLTAPTATQAASCAADGQPCDVNGDCCSLFCDAGSCSQT